MRKHITPSINKFKKVRSVIIDSLHEFQVLTSLSNQDMANLLDTTVYDFLQKILGHVEFSLSDIYNFCNNLNISIDLLFSGNVDLLCLSKNSISNTRNLPEKYADTRMYLSRAKGLHVVYAYLKDHFGTDFAFSCFKSLQVTPVLYFDESTKVSSLIGEDLLQLLYKHGINTEIFKEIGKYNSKIDELEIPNHSLPPKQLYQFLHEDYLNKAFDSVVDYSLVKLEKSSCTTIISPREEGLDIFKRVAGNRQICLFKQGVFSSFLTYIKPFSAKVEEHSCIYNGDEFCTYQTIWA